MKIKDCLKMMSQKDASDLFYRAGGPVRMRIDGRITPVSDGGIERGGCHPGGGGHYHRETAAIV